VAVAAFVVGLLNLAVAAVIPGACSASLNALLFGTQLAVTWSYLVALISSLPTYPSGIVTVGLPVGVIVWVFLPVIVLAVRARFFPPKRGAQLDAVVAHP